MKPRILVLGAGFGGLETSTQLSEAFGDAIEVTLIDKNDTFVFGYSKLDVMFGRAMPEAVRLRYRAFLKPGVRFVRDTLIAIDPVARRVTTMGGTLEGDFVIVALGADYDLAATPGLVEAGYEFYSVTGAERVRAVLPRITGGRVIVGICGAPYKCPPAPSEAALLLDHYFTGRGVRDRFEITLVTPFGTPVPPSPDTSRALIAAFAERGIGFVPNRLVASLGIERRVAVLDDGSELPFDLCLGVPKHRVPRVVEASGLCENGWVAVNPRTLETRFPGVYAVGDVANAGTPKAGVFAEGAARVVASALIATIRGVGEAQLNDGVGSCYVEFGGGSVGRVDVDFFSGPSPTGTFHPPSSLLGAEKEQSGATRIARWFTPAAIR
jgi:sulfide:quinone oxidoreductase